jgi:hypothetical protein
MASLSLAKWTAIRSKLERFWEKNQAELRLGLSGSLPRFLTSNSDRALQEEIPVFVFHSVEPERFEQQLRYLVENGYATLAADELLEAVQSKTLASRRITALTFDDATASAWTVAHPLLKKYGLKGILFAIPGLVPQEKSLSATLEDVWSGRADRERVLGREKDAGGKGQLCTWAELRAMEAAGTFDIQAHSMTHARIHTSPRMVDFLHPGYDTYFYHNVNIPITAAEDAHRPQRPLRLGQPVYASASRLSGRPRFWEDPSTSEALAAYVERRGREAYFGQKGWRTDLTRRWQALQKEAGRAGTYETRQELEAALRWEMEAARELLQEKLGGKAVEHLCYPWYQGSALSDRIAAESGYRAVYYGMDIRPNQPRTDEMPVRIRRVSEEYLMCLPGEGSRTVRQVWREKFLSAGGRRGHER